MPYGHAVIQLNPDDASLVRLYLSEQFAHADHRIREDPATVRGGCIIETNGSQLDATLATRWKRVVESMGAKNDWVETSGE
jgi:flagellar assembly protein FliH